ncbi:pyrimidine utilization flavin reductase protein F [Agrobacterium rubi]|nr:pyrimidine utilization flavin reductase protein F [Agrobacterium rubi]NTF21968.1 pyrimidine utilization flavin reductase protein F [Agrobacterium rubi]NTF28825.1 pyrimidine utilization flavin reductase protein F [Agrobacterium rubi]
MSQLAAAVNIVTTDGPGGMAGFTASAVCSVTDQPPTLLVCLNRSSSVANIFERNRVLCVNTLSHSQEVLSRRFGGSTSQEERFLEGEWSRGITGSPRLEGALLSFDCEIETMVESGTHQVLFCRIIELVQGSDENALVYFRRRYHAVG